MTETARHIASDGEGFTLADEDRRAIAVAKLAGQVFSGALAAAA